MNRALKKRNSNWIVVLIIAVNCSSKKNWIRNYQRRTI